MRPILGPLIHGGFTVTATSPTNVDDHFAGRAPAVRATYDAILDTARALGPVEEEAKKTSIHLVRRTAFAGVATRKTALQLTLKASSDIDSPRIAKRERVSANRWHVELRLDGPGDVDAELAGWLKAAYELSA